jgi:PadR family transcriptional regulator, regulatory protein PadR
MIRRTEWDLVVEGRLPDCIAVFANPGLARDAEPPCVSMYHAILSPLNPMGAPTPPPTSEILRGTFDLLILRALSWGPAHGYAVARWIEQATNDVLVVGEGTLYPALHRLEERGWIVASWGVSENNRQAKFYSLSTRGRARLHLETENWRRYAAAIFAALDAQPSGGGG